MSAIEKVLSGVNSLPTLPTVYTSLSAAIEDPRTTTDQLAKIISSDQASAFKVLKVANSPFYGFRGKIDNITQAILYLGFNEVRNIVFALSVINFFAKDKVLQKFKPVDFWAHSIGVGIATRMIGGAAGERNLENFFLGGIFHDIGKLLFFEYANKEYVKVMDVVESKNCSIREAETEIFGMDHARAGYLLAEKWKLPQRIQNIISNHHSCIIMDKSDKLVAAVHAGDIFARSLELGYAGDSLIPEPNARIWDVLNLPKGFFLNSRSKLKEDFEVTIKMMLDR